MTLEGALLAGISAVTTALVFVGKLLWEEVKECKADRAKIHEDLGKLSDRHLTYVESNASQFLTAIRNNTEALNKLTRP